MGDITKEQCLRIFDSMTGAEIANQKRIGKMLGDGSTSYLNFTENTFSAVREFMVRVMEVAESENK